ncbi:MAG: hypothetical protein HRU12_21715 [Phaeodactylibacter sp.]|nr:hypothetical protein [Phaeodactylibacter sp.]
MFDTTGIQYIEAGKTIMAVLPKDELEKLIEAKEELEDIQLYDQSKSEDDGYRIDFNDYLKARAKKNG